MSKLINMLRYAPKRTSALIAIIAAVIIVPVTLFAVTATWGPERPTYTIENPADHNTFNSITNNPDYGDERNFVTIKDTANTNAGGWTDDINVVNGKEYWVRAYVHNNAADNLDLVALNTVAKFDVPTYPAKSIQVDGFLSADNANPGTIWDSAKFKSDGDFSLKYIAGSATITNNAHPAGITLPDSIVGSGAQLGYQTLDGKIPGCFQYTAYVIFKVKATTENFSVSKTVRVNGTSDKTWKENVTVNAGDKVDYQIYFNNTGGTKLSDVVIKDTLPAGVTYVPGTTTLHNSTVTKTIGDTVTTDGIIIGSYLPGGDAYIKFTAKVASTLPTCGLNKLINTAKATTDIGSKTDTAEVDVNKNCQPKECKPGIPEGDKRCEVTPPVTPPELPQTGVGENIAAFLGLGALVTSIGYYRSSRRV